jgi:hypothetical protein
VEQQSPLFKESRRKVALVAAVLEISISDGSIAVMIGKEMEAELWGEARKLVEKFANNVSGEMDVKGNDQRTEDDAKSFAHSNNSHETSSKVRSR